MKITVSLLVAILSTVSAFAITPHEIDNILDKVNKARVENPNASIEPTYNVFVQAIDNNMEPQAARALTYLGWSLQGCNFPELAMLAFDYASSYAPDNDDTLHDLISMGLGACYAATGEYKLSENKLLESLEQSLKDKNDRVTMSLYTYLGDMYSAQAKDAKAKDAFENGRRLAAKIHDTIFESALTTNIGCLEDDASLAEEAFFRAIDLSQQCGNKVNECYAYVNLAEHYLNIGENAKALRTIEQITRLIPFIDSNDPIIAYSLTLFSSIYAARHEYDKAYNMAIRADKQESMDKQRVRQERVKFSNMLTDVVKRCETQRTSRQRHNQYMTMNVLVVIIMVVIIIAAVFFLLYRKSVRQSKLLTQRRLEINELQETSTRQNTEIDDTRRKMNYLYGFYRGRALLLERLSTMIRESYKMPSTQLTAHLRMVNNTISEGLAKDKEPEFIAELTTEESEFVKRLLARYPDMSKNDIILATYYRLGLSTREIARISGKQPTTVTTARYRLRTSLNLPEDVDLTEFFSSI